MKRTRINVIEISALLLIVIMGAFLFFFGGPVEYSKDKIVVAFGDSLTVGYGVNPPGKNYVTYLSEYTEIPIVNAGKSGDTTSDALVRMKDDVLSYNPDVVLVLLGGNDFLEGYSEEVVLANLRTIIKNLKKSDAKVILIGGSKQIVPKYEKVFEKLVFENGIDGYVPDILGGIIFRKDLLYDDIHPNTHGHEIIAQRILPVLERVLSELG